MKKSIHQLGGEALLAQKGREHFSNLGKKTLEKYGKEYFKKMALLREKNKKKRAKGVIPIDNS